MVMARRAGTRGCAVSALATVVCAKSGSQRETGSESRSRPSSTSAITATLVTALLCEAMRKIASGVIRLPASRSAQP